jgi:hypothetical protein
MRFRPIKFLATASRRKNSNSLTAFSPVKLESKWQEKWQSKTSLSQLCPHLCKELQYSDSFISIYSTEIKKNTGSYHSIELIDQKLWFFFNETPLWMGKYKFKIPIKTIKDTILILSEFKNQAIDQFIPGSISGDDNSPPIKLIHLRVNPTDISLKEQTGPTTQALYQLVTEQKPLFFYRAHQDELKNMNRVLSQDNQNLFFLSDRGMAVLSSLGIPFDQENGFYQPDQFGYLVGLALGKKICLEKLSAEFVQH